MEAAVSIYEPEYMALKANLNEENNKQAQGDPAASIRIVHLQGEIAELKSKMTIAQKEHEIDEQNKKQDEEKAQELKTQKSKKEESESLKFLDSDDDEKQKLTNSIVASANLTNLASSQVLGKPKTQEAEKELLTNAKVTSSSEAST